MKEHNLKLLADFADAVLLGEKTFEIRENDRGFQKGDTVRFKVIEKNGLEVYPKHPLTDKVYVITYVLNGWGLKNGVVVFSIKEQKNE